MADVIALRIAETRVNAGSAVVATANFRDRATSAASTPSSIRYRVDCLTNGRNVVNWTSVSAASSATITVPGTLGGIINEDNKTEQRQLLVEIDTGLSTQARAAITWTVVNHLTYEPQANFSDSLLLEPYFPITAAETAASVAPSSYQYHPGDFHRYGALGDGTTDDGAAVRAAILQSLQTGGEQPFGRSGHTYLCTTWTAVSSSSRIRLGGTGYTLKGPTGRADFVRPGAQVLVLGDVQFERWLSVFERETADTGDNTRTRFLGGQIEDVTAIPINLEVAVDDYQIIGVKLANVDSHDAIRVGTDSTPLWGYGTVAFNRVDDVDLPSTTAGGGILIYGTHTNVLGNILTDIDDTTATELWGIYTKDAYGATAFNIVDGLAHTGASGGWGITVKGDNHGGTGPGHSRRVVGNIVLNATNANGFRTQTDSVAFIGNMAEECTLGGYQVDTGNTTEKHSLVLGNFYRMTSAGSSVGVRMSSALDDVIISNNLIDNASIGVRLSTVNGDEQDYIVSSNILDVTSQGVILRRDFDHHGILVTHNIVKGTTPPSTGVRFESGAGVLSNVRVLDNDLQAATTQFSGTLPADVEIRHCWTFQTTAAGPTTALTLTLADEASYGIELRAVATLNDGAEQNLYHVEGLWFRNGGGATIVGAVQDVVAAQEVTAAWDATLTASGNNVLVRLTGEASHTINWKLWIHVLGVNAAA